MSIQDLLQHARRLARRPGPSAFCLVQLGVIGSAKANAARYHYFRNSLAELAAERAAVLVEIAGAGLCLVAEDEDEETRAAVVRLLDSEQAQGALDPAVVLETFVLPVQYRELRERLSALAAMPQESPSGEEVTPDRTSPAVDAERLAGPLTPDRLALIEDRLDGMDLEPFVRRMPVYAGHDGWQPLYVEHIIDLADLAAVFFPAVELTPGEPLFCELKRHLDRMMLVALMLNRPWRRQRTGLDLGHAAWTTDEYRRLLERLDEAERRRLTIELDWLDAIRDAATGGKLMAEMQEAGLRIAIDKIGIEILPLLQVHRLKADWLKLVCDKARLAALAEPDHLEALRRFDIDRVVLTNVDDKRVLEAGQRIGIRYFQGPLIDRLARRVAGPPRHSVTV